MSGGGSGGSKKTSDPVALTDYGRGPISQAFSPHLPGMIGMIANQLQRGYGSGGGDFASAIPAMYSPMSIFKFIEPISTTAAEFDKKKYNPINTGNPILDKLLMGEKIGSTDTSSSKTSKLGG